MAQDQQVFSDLLGMEEQSQTRIQPHQINFEEEMNISDEDSLGKGASASGLNKLDEMNKQVSTHALADLAGGSGASPLQ